MPKYGNRLSNDLLQQFKGKEKIEALLEVIGNQFDQILSFYESLNLNRALSTAQGAQLDRIGEILVLSREDASKLFNKTEAIDDDIYRRLLIYKTIMNFGSATYYDIMNCIKIIQGYNGFRYKEELERPATIIFETEESVGSDAVKQTLKTPIPKGAGIGLIIRANNGADFGIGIGFTSHVMLTKVINTEEIDVDELLIYCADENLDLLADESGDIIISEESVDA